MSVNFGILYEHLAVPQSTISLILNERCVFSKATLLINKNQLAENHDLFQKVRVPIIKIFIEAIVKRLTIGYLWLAASIFKNTNHDDRTTFSYIRPKNLTVF